MDQLANTQSSTPLGAPEPSQIAALDKIKAVQAKFGGEIAFYGGEMHIREDTGAWVPADGSMKRYFLEMFGNDPVRTGTWAAAMIYYAVDPDGAGESVYFQKEQADGQYGYWKPMHVEPWQVVFAKGVYDLRTGTFGRFADNVIPFGPLIEHYPSEEVLADVVAGRLDKAPARAAELFRMIQDAFMHNEQRDTQTEAYFQAIVAQVLRPHAGFVQFVHVVGESGARKTTILRALLSAPIGPRGLSEVTEAQLASRIFMRPKLVNKIANLSNDSAQCAEFGPFIKEVTSGILTYDKKFRDAGQVRMTAKLFSTMNRPQVLEDASLGIENRIIVFKFNPRNDNNRGSAGAEWLKAEHYTAADREWIVAWMLSALREQWQTGLESIPEAPERVKSWKEEILNEACPMRKFALETLEFGPGFEVEKNRVFDAAVDAGIAKPDDHRMKTELTKYLAQRHNVRQKVTTTKERTTCRLYTGCRLKS